MTPQTTGILDELIGLLGPSGVIADPELQARYLVDQRNQFRGRCLAVLRPRTTDEVAAIVRIARQRGVSVVPQGGNTSYCGGATPDESGRQLVISLELMNRIRALDARNFSMAVDAGAVLADVQTAAAGADLLFPLSLGAEGSCRIGGNIATNAGGLSALRYGVTRDLILGVEVVLSDGRVLSEMSTLRKNTTGYDLRQCWIGSEGTLGIVTGATLKLFPMPRRRATAWIALEQPGRLCDLLGVMRRETADLLSSFEFIGPETLRLSQSILGPLPVPVGAAGALLLEISSSSERIDLEELLATGIEAASADGESDFTGAVIVAAGERQRAEMWQIRETLPEAEKQCGGTIKHDISVPLMSVDAFIARARDVVLTASPSLGLSYYGHVGDGNIHFNVVVPAGRDPMEFLREMDQGISLALYDLAQELGGTFSAEHGVGRLKRPLLARYASVEKIDVLAAVKAALHPADVYNPLSVTSGLAFALGSPDPLAQQRIS